MFFKLIKAYFINLINYFQIRKYKTVFSMKKIDKSVNKNFRKFKKKEVLNKLNEMPIEELSKMTKSPFPISALKNNVKINYVGELKRFNQEKLQKYKGIGEKNSKTVMQTYHALKNNLLNEKKINLHNNNLNEKLLSSLYKKMFLIENHEEIETHNKNVLLTKQKLSTNLKNSFKKSVLFIWYYLKDKTKIEEAINESDIEKFYGAKGNHEKIMSGYKNADVLKEFQNNSAKFYSVLDSMSLIISSPYGYASEELVREIESLKINYDNLIVIPRRYQQFGAQFIINQKNTLIGDEMGLGKTIEAIVAMNHLFQNNIKKIIVICPLSILTNWKREIEKWSEIPAYKFYGNEATKNYQEWKLNGGVLILNYESSKKLLNLISSEIQIDMLVVDEAHYIKNPKAIRTKNVYEIKKKSEYNVFMTGTPLENNLNEMLELLHGLNSDFNYVISDSDFNLIDKDEFRKTISQLYLRRNREDVLSELPEKEEQELWVSFSEKEYTLYKEALREENFMTLRRVAWRGDNENESPKIAALLEICQMAKRENKKIIVFSFFIEVIDKIYDLLGEDAFGPISGRITTQKRQEILDDFSNRDGFAVLISQIQAGGVGLNIQAASVVILCEPQWKPSTEEQAISRAYRMGQINKVFVYRILTENSVDERILNLIHKKSQIFNDYARTSYLSTQSEEAIDPTDTNIMKEILSIEKEIHNIK